MNREAINPSDWGLQWRMNQAESVTGLERQLHCSGQVALAPDPGSEMGIRVTHQDMRGQIGSALANIDDILTEAGMSRVDILSLRFFTTDVDEFLKNYDVYANWIREAGTMPPQSLLGVSRLVLPELLVEIEATAGV